jgi:hypothetical protein
LFWPSRSGPPGAALAAPEFRNETAIVDGSGNLFVSFVEVALPKNTEIVINISGC